MAKWPDNPVYTPLSEINKGNEYEPADGIVAKDINAFIENVDYLNKAITDLDVDNIAYLNKTNTFGAVQEFAEDLLLYSGKKLRDYDDNYFDFYKFQKRTGASTFATINLPGESGTLALIEDTAVEVETSLMGA